MKADSRLFSKLDDELLLELHKILPARAWAVYFVLVSHLPKKGRHKVVWPSVTRLSALTGQSRTTVIRHLDMILEAGLMTVIKGKGKGSQYWLVPAADVVAELRRSEALAQVERTSSSTHNWSHCDTGDRSTSDTSHWYQSDTDRSHSEAQLVSDLDSEVDTERDPKKEGVMREMQPDSDGVYR